MTKLYYTPTSCGASSFISAFVAGINIDCEVVNLGTHTTDSGVDFYTINPKGNVPTIVLDDGTVLNENISCLDYISDLSLKEGHTSVSFPRETSERYLQLQHLSFIATELHPTIGLLFNPNSKEENIRSFVTNIFEKKMKYVQNNLIINPENFIIGNRFTVVDAYLHIVLGWLGYVGLNIEDYPKANQYRNFINSYSEVVTAKNLIETVPATTN